MKRVPKEVEANATGWDDWRLERLLIGCQNVFAQPFASSASHLRAGSGFQQEYC